MGPRESNIWTESFKAGSDLRLKQHYAVKLTTVDETVDICSAATDAAIGILQDTPNIAEACAVRLLGLSKAVADGTADIARGNYVGTGAAGKLIVKGTADFGVLGVALDPAAEDNYVIGVMLLGAGFFRTAAG